MYLIKYSDFSDNYIHLCENLQGIKDFLMNAPSGSVSPQYNCSDKKFDKLWAEIFRKVPKLNSAHEIFIYINQFNFEEIGFDFQFEEIKFGETIEIY